MTSPAISVRGISKAFVVPRSRSAQAADERRERRGRRHFFHALRGIAFDVPRGQTLGLIGANGSGKTTLLKIMAGVMRPDAGSIESEGRIGALLELGAGFHPELTGVENVHLNGAVLGLGRRATETFLADIIAFAELERFMHMPVKHYSSGMIVRLGFAIAAQMRPEILLLDETFAVGDVAFQARALGRIREMKAQGVTMIVVSHNAELVLELSHRILWLDRGRVMMDGEPRRVLANYRRQCGAFLAGAERVTSRLLGEADAITARPGGGRVKVLSAKFAGAAPMPEFESTDAVELDVAMRVEAGIVVENFELECLFRRDDGQVVAISRVRLPSAPGQGAGAERALRVRFEPLTLLHGEYEILLAVKEKGELRAGFAEDVLRGPKFRALTPMPPDFDFAPSFRLVGAIEGKWEARAG